MAEGITKRSVPDAVLQVSLGFNQAFRANAIDRSSSIATPELARFFAIQNVSSSHKVFLNFDSDPDTQYWTILPLKELPFIVGIVGGVTQIKIRTELASGNLAPVEFVFWG